MSQARSLSAVKLLAAVAALSCSGAALAHPGHEAAGFAAGFAHPFTGLDHLFAMVAVGLWAAQAGGRMLWAAPLAFIAAMLAGGLLGLSGFSVPLVEPMIAASVLVLGLLVGLSVRAGLRVVPLIAAFALFHGIAHGMEFHAYADATAAGYLAGFAAATAVLHMAGLGLGLLLRGRRLQARLAGAPIALAGAVLFVQALPSI